MSKFTKSLVATTLAVAVAGPATAEVLPGELGAFVGSKLKVQVMPTGCKNLKVDINQSAVRFFDDSDYRQSGYWELTGWLAGDADAIDGMYIEKKVDKELTGSLDEFDLGACVVDLDPLVDPLIPGLECWGIVEAIQIQLVTEGCGIMTFAQSNDVDVTKGKVKLSKKGEKANLDFEVRGEYTNDKGKVKNVKATVKSSNMEYVVDPVAPPVIDPLI